MFEVTDNLVGIGARAEPTMTSENCGEQAKGSLKRLHRIASRGSKHRKFEGCFLPGFKVDAEKFGLLV